MSVANTLSLPHVSSATSSSLGAATPSFWKKLRGAVWDFLVETGRRRAAYAMKHGY